MKIIIQRSMLLIFKVFYRSNMTLLFGLMSFVFLTQACSPTSSTSSTASQNSVKAQATKPNLIQVREDRTDLLFRYLDDKGEEQSAVSIKEIPATQRARVQVIDLSLSPEARRSTNFIQIFNLTQAGEQGLYAGRLIKRESLEKVLAKAQALPSQPPITLYSTNWCGVCKKAKSFMENQGLAFVEKDIEKDKKAARELQEKLQRAGQSTRGVPVIDVGGQLMTGFDPQRLLALAQKNTASTTTSTQNSPRVPSNKRLPTRTKKIPITPKSKNP
jgi:glutaredoxin